MKIDNLQPAIEAKRIVVACSGGIDSSVLLHLLKEQFSTKLKVFHCNYKLRGEESDQDQLFIEEICKSYGVDCQIHVVEKPYDKTQQKGMGIQEWARSVRRQCFAKFIADGCIVALGHTRDDLAENIFLKMIRGTSMRHGLGMSEFKDGIYRPILSKSKAEVVFYAKKNQLKYRVDSSNLKTEYRRNFVRLKIFPVLEELQPGFKDRLIFSTQDASNSLNFLTDILISDVLEESKGLKIDKLLRHQESVALELLSSFLNPDGGIQLSRDFLLNIFNDLKTLERKKFLKRQLNAQTQISAEEGYLKKCEVSKEFKHVRSRQHDKNFSQRNLAICLSQGAKLCLNWQRGEARYLDIRPFCGHPTAFARISCLKDKSELGPGVRKSFNNYRRFSSGKDRARPILVRENHLEKPQQSYIWHLNADSSKPLGNAEGDLFKPTVRIQKHELP